MTKRNLVALVLVLAMLTSVACLENNSAATQAASSTRQIKVDVGTLPAFYEATVGVDQKWIYPHADEFVLVGHPLTPTEVRILGLHKDVLKKDAIFLNEDRRRHTFVPELLKKGTLVWADDKTGTPRYKFDCGNVLVRPMDYTVCPPSVVCNGPHTTFSAVDGSVTTAGTFGKSWTDWLWNLLKFLGLLILVALAIMLLIVMIDAIRQMIQQLRNPPPPVPPTPPVTPIRPVTPVVPPVIPPAPPVVVPPAVMPAVPVSTTTTQRFGPYTTVRVEDLGTRGYRAYGDGVAIGDFTTPVATEDAGAAGHYVVVTTTT